MPTVLVADDSSNIQKMVTMALKEEGYDVVAVGNGEAVLRKVPELVPDVIVADIFMPVRTGYEICDFINNNERFNFIPVILMAGQHDLIVDQDMQRAKPYHVLIKPADLVPPTTLLSTVKGAVAKCDQQRPPWAKKLEKPKPPAAADAPAVSTQRLSADEIARMVEERRAAAAKPEATVMMNAEEVAQLLGEPVAPDEPPPDAFATAPERLEIEEGEQPLAFGDLLGTPDQRQGPPAEAASGFEVVPVGEEAPAEEEVSEEERQAIEWGGITEELKQPTPDEPPIKVDFGESEPMELVTDEHISPQIEAPPLADLASSPSEWIAPPAPSAGPAPVEDFIIPGSAPAVPPPAEEVAAASNEVPSPFATAPEEAASAPAPPATPEVTADTQRLELEAIREAAAVPQAPPAAPEPEPQRAAEPLAVPQPVDPALVDAVVEKVLARLGPEILDRLAHEVLRPLAEEIARRERT